jgi:hypothetical protein
MKRNVKRNLTKRRQIAQKIGKAENKQTYYTKIRPIYPNDVKYVSHFKFGITEIKG